MRKIIFLLPFFIISSGFVNKSNPDGTPEGVLLFASGFENGVSITEDASAIAGFDKRGFDWGESHGCITSTAFGYMIAKESKITDFQNSHFDEIIGPKGNKTRTLVFENIKDDPDHNGTSRTEYEFFTGNPENIYKEGYVRYWMKLEEKLGDIIPYEEESPWYMIMEWKEPNSRIRKSREECKKCCNADPGGTNNYRINIGLQKMPSSNDFTWVINGEHPQPCRIREWRYLSEKIEISFGEWFLVEAYMKKHNTDGRVYFAVNGKVILDTDIIRPDGFTGRTQHPDNPLNLNHWSALKNYHGMRWNVNGPIRHWYDDFEMWSSFPPDHPALKTIKQ